MFTIKYKAELWHNIYCIKMETKTKIEQFKLRHILIGMQSHALGEKKRIKYLYFPF